MTARHFFAAAAAVFLFLNGNLGYAQTSRANPESWYSSSDFGGIGLLQTRTARFAQDGQFDVGFSNITPYRRYLINVQALPWVEGTFRYTAIENRGFFSTGPKRNGEPSFKDRGADLKFRLLEEGRFRPALALGLQDGLGTGVFSGEYVVMSKRFRDLDFSFGMGWGNNGASGGIRNPFRSLSDTFATRGGGTKFGGTLNFKNWFHGEEVALFGGVEYFTPIKGISLKLERDGNDYQSDPLTNKLDQTSSYNFGINYRPFSWIEFSSAYERGELFMFRATLRANFQTAGAPKLDPDPPKLAPRPLPKTDAKVRSPVALFAAPVLRRFDELSARRVSPAHIAIRDHLAAAGINVAAAGGAPGETKLIFVGRSELPPRDVLSYAAKMGAEAGADEVRFETDRMVGPIQSVEFSIGAVSEADIAGHFVDELETLGLTLLSLSFDQSEVRVEVAQAIDTGTAERVSRLVFDAIPEPVPFARIESVSGEVTFSYSREALRGVADGSTASRDMGSNDGVPVSFVASQPFILKTISEAIFADMSAVGLAGESVALVGDRITVRVVNLRYTEEARAIGRAVIVAANHAPPNIEEIEVVTMTGGVELARIVVLRRDVENAFAGSGSAEEILVRATFEDAAPRTRSELAALNKGFYPATQFSIAPVFKQHIGGGDVFLAYALGVRAGASVELMPGVSLVGSVSHNVTDTFDKLTVSSDTTLPRVRSNIRQYLQGSDASITRVQANYLAKISNDLFFRASAGLFEEMYGGYSGEVLYRPFGGRLAAGVDLNWVRQRDFLGRFGFFDYSVLTGHLNVYYDSPFQDLLFQVHAGQYLAGDRGATFQVSRRFESGIRAGVFTTLTDVPFSTFGEGSFDKGFFVSIPLEVFLVTRSRQGGAFGFRPLTKDGGQQVAVTPRLYDVTSQGNIDNIRRDWDKFLQ